MAETVDLKSLGNSHLTTVINVSTTATALPTTALAGRKSILIQNVGTNTAYLGNGNITANEESTGGHQLQNNGDTWVGDFTGNNVVYGRCATGSSTTLCIWEVR